METLIVVAGIAGMALLLCWAVEEGGGRAAPAPVARVVIDALGVRRELGDGRVEAVRWAELVAVDIVTTSAGPWCEDLFWVLAAGDGSGCLVPGGDAGPLLERLGPLPRFAHEAVIRACGSTSEAIFEVWRGVPGEAAVAGESPRGSARESAGESD